MALTDNRQEPEILDAEARAKAFARPIVGMSDLPTARSMAPAASAFTYSARRAGIRATPTWARSVRDLGGPPETLAQRPERRTVT